MKPAVTERDSSKTSPHANKGTGADDDSRGRAPGVAQETADSLAKVQELLFGVQFREHAQRMAHLEESLVRVANELKQEWNRRFDSLESAMKDQGEALTAQIKSEHQGRSQAIAGIVQDLDDLGKTVATSTAQIDQQVSTEHHELRQRMADQQQTLSTEIQQKNKELSAVMEAALAELRREKVTRAVLAELFAESAQSLRGDLAQTSKK